RPSHLETLSMSFLTLFRHLKWNCARDLRGQLRPRRVRPREAGRPPRWIPRLEVLEDRNLPSTLTVSSVADDGSAGTLRAVLASAQNGDTIKFAKQLQGQTITLALGQLVIKQSLVIDGPGAGQLAISGNAASRIFDVSGAATVTISGLTLTGGLATDG